MSSLITAEKRKQLIEAAVAVKSKAYCPASHFPVGCAVLSRDGPIFIGCNVENASYPCGSCAEVGAVANAVSQGHHKLIAAAVAADVEDTVTPCGKCRQVLAEFMLPESPILLVNKRLRVEEMRLETLLPHSFKFELLPGNR
ncbi:Cytidine deaminase [Fasciola gigantica]|uniref:Cytidine deaminase n=1 Tax=Fasciola gigantica TaxID=46835 RepID=A0A504YDF5_FASGI|nr:Cytidine deaminase [Fasciola gigantica]